MEKFYSQHGEDFLIDKIFDGKREGFFVEVGCVDGIEYSNTFHFENKGWKGLCIEAHYDFIEPLKRNRPNSQIVHCAVGEENKDKVTFLANKVAALSALHKSDEAQWKKGSLNRTDDFVEQEVQMRTLTSIFEESSVREIDFLSLDIEGYEIFALRGLDLAKYKPRLLVIEFQDDNHRSGINEILSRYHYFFLGTLGCNIFYSLKEEDAAIFNASYGEVILIHHDQSGVEIKHLANLIKPNLYRKVKYHSKKLLNFFLGRKRMQP